MNKLKVYSFKILLLFYRIDYEEKKSINRQAKKIFDCLWR